MRNKLLVIIAWIWIAAGLLWYYYLAGHSPSSAVCTDWICTVGFLAAKHVFLPYLIGLCIFYAGFVVGLAMFYNEDDVEIGLLEIAKATGLGLGIISLVTFMVGLLNIHVALVLSLLLVWFCLDLRPERISYKLPMHPMYLCVVVLVLLQAHYALMPVIAWDSLNSHLEAPRVFLETDRITFNHYINFNNFPMNLEMLYFFPLLLRCPEATQVIGYLFFILTLCAIIGWDYLYGKYAAIIACMLFFTMPHFVQFSAVAMTDVPLMFYVFMGVMSFLSRGTDNFQRGMWWGLALGVKYFAVIPLFWMVAYGVYSRRWHTIAYILGVALLIGSPYYIRNIVLFGNPVFPFADSLFGWFPGVLDKTGLTVDGIAMLDKFKYPRDFASAWTWIFDITTVARWGTIHTQYGPALLIGLPFVVYGFAKGANKAVVGLAVIALGFVYTQIFILGILDTRYMFSVLPFFCILVGWSVGGIRWRWWMALLGTLILCMWLYHVMMVHVWTIGMTEEHRYQMRCGSISSYEATTKLNDNSNRDEVVYAYFAENNRFYSVPKMIGGLYGWADHKSFAQHCGSAPDLWLWLRQYGTDWLLVDKLRLGEAASLYPEMNLPLYLEPWFYKGYENNNSIIYHLGGPFYDEKLDNYPTSGYRTLADFYARTPPAASAGDEMGGNPVVEELR